MQALADAGVPTLAVDIPSGIDGTTGEVRGAAVRAHGDGDCFAALKPGLLFEPGRGCAGRVHVVDIGIDVGRRARRGCTCSNIADLALPRRASDGHKWSAAAFVVGGSTGLSGAPLMAGHAAARSGAGMVVCGVPGIDAADRAGGSELVTRALPATTDGALDADAADGRARRTSSGSTWSRSGPASGATPETQAAVRRLVAECPLPIVVDADGAERARRRSDARCTRAARPASRAAVLTPHGGEYDAPWPVSRPVADRVAAARDLAGRGSTRSCC